MKRAITIILLISLAVIQGCNTAKGLVSDTKTVTKKIMSTAEEPDLVVEEVVDDLIEDGILLSIPSGIPGIPGLPVLTTVQIDNATGIKAVTFDVFYDPRVLSITIEDISLADLWTIENGWSILGNVVSPGHLRVGTSNPIATATGGGTIVNLIFTILSGSPSGSTILDIEHASRRSMEDGILFRDSDGSVEIGD